jgi:hypothetical protein
MSRLLWVFALLTVLGACSEPKTDAPDPEVMAAVLDDLPPMRRFTARPGEPPARANADMARDFLDLAYRMESGRPIPRLSRFEGPIGISVAPDPPPTLGRDLDELIRRLRREAGIDIRRLPDGSPAQIVIVTPTRAQIQGAVPEAACFVVPNISSWEDFQKNGNGPGTDWSRLTRRTLVGVFIPRDASPQEIRDCLHEEIAQALGPLNDLFRLPDSVFNDDNIQAVLTGFDMLMLKTHYAPELANAPDIETAAAALPALLARLNPRGERVPAENIPPTTRDWIDAVKSALGPRGSLTARQRHAARALGIARREGWTDTRLGFSYYVVGRLAIDTDIELAFTSLIRAYDVYRNLFGTDNVHTATVAMQLAAFALVSENPDTALELIDQSLPASKRGENAILLATFLFMRSEALEAQGRVAEAQADRLDSFGWARYGFGLAETLALSAEEAGVLPAKLVE